MMAQFDHAIKQIAETTGRPLERIAGVECLGWGPLERGVPGSPRFDLKQPVDRFVSLWPGLVCVPGGESNCPINPN